MDLVVIVVAALAPVALLSVVFVILGRRYIETPGERHGASIVSRRGGLTGQTRMNLEGFLAPVRAEEIARMLAEWQWLPIRGLMPVGLTLLGDVILLGRDGSVHFVDTSFGVLERIADSDAQLRHRLDSEEGFATALLRSDLVDAMRSVDVITTVDREGIRRGKVSELPAGSIFGFAVPLIAGGRPDASNVLVTSAAVYLDGLGQLTRGAVSLSPGTEFRVAFEQFPDPEPPPPGARRRRLVRAARDRAPLRSPR